MSEKEKDSKQEKSKEHYDWRGNVAVYSESFVSVFKYLIFA